MRILMLAQFYPPILGGIERHVQALGGALAARGHEVAVATIWHPGLADFEMDGAVRVYRIRATTHRLPGFADDERRHAPPFPDPEIMLALRRIVVKQRPQIVHAHNWLVHSFLPLAGATDSSRVTDGESVDQPDRPRLVVTLHDCSLACAQMRMMYLGSELCSGPEPGKCLRCSQHQYGRVKGAVVLAGHWAMGRVARHRVDMFLPVSRAVADANQLAKIRVPYEVVPNFVSDDVGAYSVLDQPADVVDSRLADLPSEPFILQVGDLSRDKGIEVLLDAYAGLTAPPPLVLIGRRLPETPRSLPPNVTVIESLPYPLVMEAWRRSLFGTVPSICIDACPTVTLEAMAWGRPVIGSRRGGIVDQIEDGQTGLLVPPGDSTALRDAMARLIADPVLRARMGASARESVTRFRAATVASRIESIYSQLLGTTGRLRPVWRPTLLPAWGQLDEAATTGELGCAGVPSIPVG